MMKRQKVTTLCNQNNQRVIFQINHQKKMFLVSAIQKYLFNLSPFVLKDISPRNMQELKFCHCFLNFLGKFFIFGTLKNKFRMTSKK